jgi:hypothetical protein
MSANKRRQGQELELFLQSVAEVERLYIEAYGHEAYLNQLRELIDDPGRIRHDGENLEAVRQGLIKKLHQKMQ